MILRDKIVDLNDGSDDYVPIKSEATGYLPMKADKTGYTNMKSDLDDIVVPELAKYGISGIGQIWHEADGSKPPVKTWFC